MPSPPMSRRRKMKASDLIDFNDDAPPASVINALDEYFAIFRKPKDGLDCACGKPLTGFFGTFKWGIAHGEGFCSSCGQPVRMFHSVSDESGEILSLQYPLCYLPLPNTTPPSSAIVTGKPR